MKKVGIILLSVFCAVSVFSQDTTTMDYREYGDQYLLPGTYFEDTNCAILDVYSKPWSTTHGRYGEMGTFSKYSDTKFYIVDVAQPYYTDTTITIIGISVLAGSAGFGDMHANLCIADDTVGILRKAPLESKYIFGNHPFWGYTLLNNQNYTEVFFDTAVNVNGLFYAVYDSPKPYPYDADSYNWGPLHDGTWISAEQPFSASLGACAKRDWLCDSASSDGSILIRRMYAYISTTPNTTTWTAWDSNDYDGSMTKDFFFIFPIIGELDTTSTTPVDSSSVASIKIDKFTHIFPNPASDNISVHCSFMMKEIEIFNEQGQKVYSKELNDRICEFDMSKYPAGSYIVKIRTNNGSCSKKIVVH